MAIVKVDPALATTHLLVGQRSACGNPIGKPPNWPPMHCWVRTERGFLVTCPKCQGLLKEIHAERKGNRNG